MNHTLKPQYVNNVPFLDGELTIVTSDHAEASMRHSSRLANSFRKAGLNVLVINCGMSDRRFRSHYYDAYGHLYQTNGGPENVSHGKCYRRPRRVRPDHS
jgi:hypothetical protein